MLCAIHCSPAKKEAIFSSFRKKCMKIMLFIPPNGRYLNKKQYLCDRMVAKDKNISEYEYTINPYSNVMFNRMC